MLKKTIILLSVLLLPSLTYSGKSRKKSRPNPSSYPKNKPITPFQIYKALNVTSNNTLNYASFYALMPDDNLDDIEAGSAVEFPQNGPTSGTITRAEDSNSTFILPDIGTYEVTFQVYVGTGGQLVLGLDSGSGIIEIPATVIGSRIGNCQFVESFFITTTVANSLLSVRNPFEASPPALHITASAGGNDLSRNPIAATLTIKQLK